MALSDLIGGLGVGGVIGQAIVRLELDTKKYQAELAAAQGQTSKFAGLASTAYAAVGLAAVAGLAYAIKAGSDLNEQLNKTKVVFGDAANEVIKFSETTAESLGIAQSEALAAAGQFGQLFDAAGLTASAAADMSQKFVTLAADLGSFNNIPVAEALQKLRGGLAGEAEPLRQLGVFLSEARVKAEAYSSGIARVGEELTDAQKIQARYNIILDDTTKAQGDFGRTLGESLPNQMKVLSAELKDLAADIGTEVLPAVLELVKALKELLEIAKDIGAVVPNTKNAISELGGSLAEPGTEGAREATKALFDFNGVVEQTGAGTERLKDGIENVTSSYRDMDGELHTITTTYQLFNDGSKLAIATIEDTDTALTETGKAVAKTGKEFVKAGAQVQKWSDDMQDALEDSILKMTDFTSESDIMKSDFITATREMKEDARQFARAMEELAEADWVNKDYVKFLSEQGPEWVTVFASLTEEQGRRQQASWRETKGFLDDANKSQERMLGLLRDLDGKTSKHTVIIDYQYEGFDPTKPGMLSPQQR